MRVLIRCASTFFCVVGFVANSFAAYPEKSIRILIPFPPGGVTDVLARAIGIKLTEKLGQQVVIDNRGGAGGTIGGNIAAKAAPDGYTLFLGTFGTHAVNYALVEKLPYHPLNDFAPVIPIAAIPNILIVSPSSQFKSLADVISAARIKPGGLTAGGTGFGTAPNLILALLKKTAKVDIVEVMYSGGAPALTALLSGEVNIVFDSAGTTIPRVSAGTIRALATSGSHRVKALPDVPTIAESGYPGFDIVAWFALWAPSGTPSGIVRKLNEEINSILSMPDVSSRFSGLGAEVMGGTVEAFAKFHHAEFERWTTFVKAEGMKIQY